METTAAGKPDASLLAAAGAASSAPLAAPGATGIPAGRNWHREAADIVAVVASMRHAFPSLAAIYTPQTCDELANAWAPILERHDIDLGKFMIYVTAAGITIPVAVSTARAIKADIRSAKTARPAPAPQAASPEPTASAPAASPEPASVDLEVHNPPMVAAGPVLEGAPAVQE
jgi:hypothetical protein